MSLSTPFSGPDTNRRYLTTGLGLAAVSLAIDVIGAVLTGSLVLLADAGHRLASIGHVVFALLATTFVRDRPTAKRRYRHYRAALVTLVLNVVALLGIVLYVLVNARRRILQPPRLDGRWILAIAAAGVAIDISGRLVSHANDRGIAARSSSSAALAPRWTSIGVMLAAVMMNASDWDMIDALGSAVLGITIVPRTWSLLRNTADSLVEAAPADVDIVTIYNTIRSAEGVQGVHDFHMWTAGPGLNAVSAHVSATRTASVPNVLSNVHQVVGASLNVQHLTIQVEPDGWREPKTTP